MSTFELNANAHFSIRANVLSMTIEIFENATNYIYDSEKEKYRFFRIEILSQKKKKKTVWKSMKKKFFEIWKKKAKRKEKFSTAKFVRIDNYLSKKINDDDKMMKNVKIKSTNKFSLFQEFDEKHENIKSNLKKKCLQENWWTSSKMMFNLINLWKKYWINRWKKSRWKIFSTVSMLYRNFFSKESMKKKKRWKSRIWRWKKWKCQKKSKFQNSLKDSTLSKFRKRLFL